MIDNFLAGLLIGLLTGGLLGVLTVALVASGSEQRLPRALEEAALAADISRPSGQGGTESFPRVDLLRDLRGLKGSTEPSAVGADDIEQIPSPSL